MKYVLVKKQGWRLLTVKWVRPALFPAWSLLICALGPASLSAQATHFVFNTPPSSPANTYDVVVANSVTFQVQVQNAANALVTGFNDNVMAGLFSTATSLVSDPQAVFTSGGTTYIGSAPISFVNGVANFGITLAAGCDSEQLVLQDFSAPLTQGATYPGSLGVTTGAALTVRGFPSQPLFPRDADFNGSSKNQPADFTPALYTVLSGLTDPLSTDDSAVTFAPAFGDYGDMVPRANGGGTTTTSGIDPNASCYVTQGFTGGYAAGGAGVSVRLWFAAAANNTPVTYQMIIDYDGSLTDYNNPGASKDTVLLGSTTVNTAYAFHTAPLVPVGGFQPFQPFMLGGAKVIFRVWTSATGSVTMKYANTSVFPPNDNTVSFIKVPYSSQNVLPLRSTVTAPSYTLVPSSPPYVLSGSSPVTLVDTFKNQFSSPLTQIVFQIPADPLGLTNWVISSVSAPTAAHPGSGSVFSSPSGTTNGAVSVYFNSGNPVTMNELVPITIIGQSPATDFSWPLSILSATTNTGSNAPFDSVGVVVNTLGVPNVPGSFTASPVNFAGAGGQLALAWNQVANEQAMGYLIQRNPVGSFGGPVTLPDGSVYSNAVTQATANTAYLDSPVSNLAGYAYTLAAFNSVTHSATAPAGPATAFANPGAPGSLTALTGGTTVQLNWSAPASVSGSYPVNGYQVFRNGSPVTTIVTGASSVTWQDTGLSGGTNYNYYVSDFDNVGSAGVPSSAHNSGPSNTDSGFPLGNPPGLGPVVPTLSGPNTYLALSWTAPVKALNSINSYNIWRQTGVGAFVSIGNSAATTFDDSPIAIGASYNYYVQAVDSFGNISNNSNTMPGQLGPVAPQGFLASGGPAAVTLTWQTIPAGADNAVSYALFRAASSGTVTLSQAAGGGAAQTLVNAAGLQPGIDYSYYVAGIDSTPVTGANSTTLVSALIPSPPTGFSAAFTANQLNASLDWSAAAVTNLTGYNLYRNTTPVTTAMTAVTLGYPGNLAGPVTDAATLSAGITYYYFLQSTNHGGASSFVTAGFQMPPLPPTGLAGHSSSSAVTLTWNASPKASFYTVYETSPSSITLGTTVSPSYVVSSGLSPGTDYAFQVTASDTGVGLYLGGEGLPTASLTWGLLPQPIALSPSLSVSLLSAANQTAVTLGWSADIEANATGVSVLYGTGLPAAASRVLFPASASSGFVSMAPDSNYTFWVEGINNYGAGSPVTVSAPATLSFPAAVNLHPIVLASDGVSRIINWNPKDAYVTQFILYREVITDPGNWFPVTQMPGNVSLPVTISVPVQPDTTYIEKVVAFNPTGTGPDSNPQTFSSLPAPPANVAAQSGLSTASAAVSLSWADPSAGAEGVSIYTVYRSTSNATTATYAAVGSVTVSASPTPPISYTDNSPVPATLYYYIIAADASGVTSQLQTNNAVSVTSFKAPNSPGILTPYPSNGAVSLSWSSAVSTTYPVAGYNIYRSLSASVTGTTPLNSSPVTAAFYTDTGAGVVNGTTYYYWVGTVDSAGNISVLSGPVGALPLNAPGVPGNMFLASGDEAVQVTWNPSVAGSLPLGGYQVYRATSLGGPYAPLTFLGPTATGYIDGIPPTTLLTNGQAYYYYVLAVDNSGITTGLDISANSVTVNGTPLVININPPSNVAAAGGVGQVGLSWTDAFSGLGAPVTGYQIYRSTGSPNSFSLFNTVGSGASPVTDLTVNNGTTYYYYFISYANNGTTSAASATIFATPARPPSAPVGLVETDANASVTLGWTPNTPVDNVPVTQYVVYRNAVAAVTVYNAAATVDAGLIDGNTYDYQILAVNANGVTGSLSSPVTGYPYALTAPISFISGGGVTFLALSWNVPLTNTYPLANYDLVRSLPGGTSPVTTNPAASPVTDTTVSQGQLYVYTIQAMDTKGHLGPAAAAVSDAACIPPTAPLTLVATAGDHQILIDFPASPAAVGSLPVSYYILTGSDGVSLQLPATQTWYLDNKNGIGLADPTTVTYSLQAVDETGIPSGNHISASVASAPATTAASLLNPPTGLAARALTNSKAQITWAQPNFGGRIVSGFNIYRGRAFGNYSLIASIPNPPAAPATAYVDMGLFANNTYYYVVTAIYQSVGVGTSESPYSNHAVLAMPQGTNAPTVSSGQMAFDANLVLPNSGQKLGLYFVSPASGPVVIKIYTIAGTLVKTLNPPPTLANNPENLTWDMTDRNGSVVASGIYFIEMNGPGGFHVVKKVAVVK